MTNCDRNIILVGFMGCGKTTVGKRIAVLMGYDFIDTDQEIERIENMSVPHIFEQYGESYFRRMETEVAERIAKRQRCVASTGGGMIQNEKNMGYLQETGIVFYLRASVNKIYANTEGCNHRPLLNVPDRMGRIKELLRLREPMYEKYCDYIIDADASPETVATSIIEKTEE